MDKFVELDEYQTRQLLSELLNADRKGDFGLRKLRVYVGDDGAKFKVNEWVWSPPMGKVVRPE